MGFIKSTNEPDITIVVTHPWHEGDVYSFTFPKRLPQAAVDAEKRFLGLKDEARPDESRRALIETLAEMVTREPEGFDDFPSSATEVDAPMGESLARRFVEYFDDYSQPEFESILVSVWRAYRASAVPDAFPSRIQDSGARDSNAARAASQA